MEVDRLKSMQQCVPGGGTGLECFASHEHHVLHYSIFVV